MFLLENPISFFDKLDDLAYCILDTVTEASTEKEWDFIGLLFSTKCKIPQLDNQQFIKTFSLRLEEKDEEYEDSDYLTYTDLIKVSIDNNTYYNLNPCADDNILEVINKSKRGNNCAFYICDLTEKFYCKITDENKDYFYDKINEQLTSDDSEETGNPFKPRRTITLYYRNIDDTAFHAFKQLSTHEKLHIDVDGFNSPVLFFVECESMEDVRNVEYRPISAEAVWEWERSLSDSFFNSDGENNDYKEIIKPFIDRIKSKRKELLEDSNCPDTLNLFERKITVDKSEENSDKMNILASVVSSICYDFDLGGIYSKIRIELEKEWGSDYRGYISEDTQKKCYSLLVENTLAEGITLENIANNLTAAYEEYYMFSVNGLGVTESLKANPCTYLLYSQYAPESRALFEEMFNTTVTEKFNAEIPDLDLLSFKYLNDFFIAMAELGEKAESYANDIDNFAEWNEEIASRSQTVTEMISSSIANSITEGIYKLHKARKLNSSYEKKMLDEFMNTDSSRAFIRELIYMDAKYLLMKQWEFFEIMYKKFLDQCSKLNSPDREEKLKEQLYKQGYYAFDGLFEAFYKSLKLYSIAVAKHLNLFSEPIYEGMDEYNDMDALSVIQSAILEFPFERTYYEKYVEFGGEITDDLMTFATLNMIDIDDMYQSHLEEIQKQKALKEEQERAEAERKRKEEEDRALREKQEQEKIRLEEERKRKAAEQLKEQFGDISSKHSGLFAQLAENPLFLEYSEQVIGSHLDISNIVFDYLDKHYKDKPISMYSVTSQKFKSKQSKLASVYSRDAVNENNVLFFFDNTVFGGAKEGFVLTKDALCYKNIMESPRMVNCDEINSIVVKEKYLYVNDSEKIECYAGIGLSEIVNILIFCICNLLALKESGSQAEAQKSVVQLQTPKISLSKCNGDWVCQCGANNLTISKFCTQCGTRRPEANSKWVCLNCNAENLPTAKFCDQCGKAKP